MLSGLMAILLLQRFYPNKELLAASLIMFGAVLDFLDGYLARKLNAESGMGKQLDSFADFITFGIAPLCLVNSVFAGERFFIVIISSAVYLAAGAYRLARYNLNDFKDRFIGLPITASGVLLVIYCMVQPALATCCHSAARGYIAAAIIFLLSVLMISKMKIKRACIPLQRAMKELPERERIPAR